MCIGRYEGTNLFLGRRESTSRSLQSLCTQRLHLKSCVVPPRSVGTSIRKSRQDTLPPDDDARINSGKTGKIRSQEQCVP